MTPLIKQLVLGGYTQKVPQDVLGEYLDRFYASRGSWDIIAALDEWLKMHDRNRRVSTEK